MKCLPLLNALSTPKYNKCFLSVVNYGHTIISVIDVVCILPLKRCASLDSDITPVLVCYDHLCINSEHLAKMVLMPMEYKIASSYTYACSMCLVVTL